MRLDPCGWAAPLTVSQPKNWVPMEGGWRRLVKLVRSRRYPIYRGPVDVAPPDIFLCSLPTGHDGACKP